MRQCIAISVVSIAFAGCQGSTQTGSGEESRHQKEEPAAEDPLVVLVDGDVFRGPQMQLSIQHAGTNEPDIEIAFSASSGVSTWSAIVKVAGAPEFLERRSASAVVVDTPLSPGEASIARSGVAQGAVHPARAELARSGAVSLQIDSGIISGHVTSDEPGVNATFSGPYAVICNVPANVISGSAAAPVPDDPSNVVFVADHKFESPLCQPFAVFATE